MHHYGDTAAPSIFGKIEDGPEPRIDSRGAAVV
jgi:hypothetical protein